HGSAHPLPLSDGTRPKLPRRVGRGTKNSGAEKYIAGAAGDSADARGEGAIRAPMSVAHASTAEPNTIAASPTMRLELPRLDSESTNPPIRSMGLFPARGVLPPTALHRNARGEHEPGHSEDDH